MSQKQAPKAATKSIGGKKPSSEAMQYDEGGTHHSPIALEIEADNMDSNMTPQKTVGAHRRPRYAFLVMSEKGGVGKSTIAMTLLDYLRTKMSQRVLAIDVDSGNSTLAKSYGLLDSEGTILANENQVEDGVVRCEHSEEGFLRIFEALHSSDADHVLLDFPGGAIKGFTGLFPSSDSFDRQFSSVGFKPVVIVPFDEQPNQSESVGSIVGRIGKRTIYVVIQNPRYSESNTHLNAEYQQLKKQFLDRAVFMSGSHLNGLGRDYFAELKGVKFSEAQLFAISDSGRFSAGLSADWLADFLLRQYTMWGYLVAALDNYSHALEQS